MGFGDNVPPSVRVSAFPAVLATPNRIHIMWITFVGWDFVHVRWAVNGDPETQLRLGKDQVEVSANGLVGEWDLKSTIPGARYSIAVQRCNQGGFGLFPASCGPWSARIEVRTARNLSSMRSFLMMSGIDTSRPVSIRALRPHAPTISVKGLLDGN